MSTTSGIVEHGIEHVRHTGFDLTFARMLHEETKTSSYSVLYLNIMDFSSHREVILVGDFNARTGTH